MVLYNSSSFIGLIIDSGTSSLTGDLQLTLFLIFIFLMVIGLMFNLPIEYLAIVIIPITLTMAVYYSIFWIPLLIIIIYVATIITKNWIFR